MNLLTAIMMLGVIYEEGGASPVCFWSRDLSQWAVGLQQQQQQRRGLFYLKKEIVHKLRTQK